MSFFSQNEPPEPFSFDNAPPEQVYLIGKHIGNRAGKRAEEKNAFVAVSRVWPGLFDTYRKAKLFLDKHPEIRTRKPRPNRLEVHVGDLLRCRAIETKSPEPTDDQIEQYFADCNARKSEIDRKRYGSKMSVFKGFSATQAPNARGCRVGTGGHHRATAGDGCAHNFKRE